MITVCDMAHPFPTAKQLPAERITPPPRIGTLSPTASGIACPRGAEAAPRIGTLTSPDPLQTGGVPPIGTLTAVPARSGASAPVPVALRAHYEPPAVSIPDPPKITGKWVARYTRDRKSYVVPGLDGMRQTDTLTRATTHAKTLDDTTALADWRLRATVLGLVRNPELLDELNVDGAEHISELDFGSKLSLTALANKAARRVGADDGNTFGSKLHKWTEAIIEGVATIDDAPATLRPYLIVLFAAMRAHNLNFVTKMSERTVFIPATGMIGTFDFLLINEQGELLVGDLKTSSSIDYSWLSIAIQLAQYANATMMLSWDGTRWEAMPPVSKVIAKVIVVPKDAAIPFGRIYTVDLTLGTSLMELATYVRTLHEVALRAASHPELRRANDQLIAWADGQPALWSA